MNAIKKIILSASAAFICGYLLCGCGSKTALSVQNGTYGYVTEDGKEITCEITDKTITMHDPTGQKYEGMKTIYAFRMTNSTVAEKADEGIELSKDERNALFKQFYDQIDFSQYDGVPMEYTTEVFEDDMEINLYALDQDGKEIWGYQETYYCREKELSGTDDFMLVQNYK